MRQWKFRGYLPLAVVMAVAVSVMGAYGKAKGKADSKEEKVDAVLFVMPLENAVNINAGTLEVRFSLDYSFDDSLRPAASRCVPFEFLQVYGGDGVSYFDKTTGPAFGVRMYQSGGAHSFWFGYRGYYYETNDNPPAHNSCAAVYNDREKGPWLKAGEWHTFAATWRVDNEAWLVELFIDGKPATNRRFPKKESDVGPFAKGDFMGIGGESLSAGTIQSYRLSNRVRTKEEIASEKPLVSDDATTFFMNGDTAEKIASMKSKDYAAMKKNKKINIMQPVFVGEVKIVNTPKGKAIQFYKKKSR